MEPLTERDRAELAWMIRVNGAGRENGGRGLYGPTVRRLGSVPECDRLTAMGIARLSEDGYWILPAGRAEALPPRAT